MAIKNRNVNVTQPGILRVAGQHGTDYGLLWTGPGYVSRSQPSRDSAGTPLGATGYYNQRHGAIINSFELHTQGGAINVGIGFRWAWHAYRVGRYDGTTYTDITSDAQRRVAVAIQVTGADQTGMVILSRDKFDWVSGDLTTAETNPGADVDHVLRYSDQEGDGWITVAAASAFADSWTTTNAVWAAGAHNFVWAAPSNWGRTQSTGLDGLPGGFYALHMQSTARDADDVAAILTGIEVGTMWSIAALADNGIWEQENAGYYDKNGEALVAFFGTADAGNRVIANVESA